MFREVWSMKKIKEAVPYLATLIALELFIFFAIYFSHSFIFKGFPIADSMAKGTYAIFWRVISLQIFIQIGLMLSLPLFKAHKNLLFLLLAVIGSLIIAISIVYTPSHLSKLVTLPSREEIGEGVALIFSITLAWLFIRCFKVLNIGSGVKNT